MIKFPASALVRVLTKPNIVYGVLPSFLNSKKCMRYYFKLYLFFYIFDDYSLFDIKHTKIISGQLLSLVKQLTLV